MQIRTSVINIEKYLTLSKWRNFLSALHERFLTTVVRPNSTAKIS